MEEISYLSKYVASSTRSHSQHKKATERALFTQIAINRTPGSHNWFGNYVDYVIITYA